MNNFLLHTAVESSIPRRLLKKPKRFASLNTEVPDDTNTDQSDTKSNTEENADYLTSAGTGWRCRRSARIASCASYVSAVRISAVDRIIVLTPTNRALAAVRDVEVSSWLWGASKINILVKMAATALTDGLLRSCSRKFKSAKGVTNAMLRMGD